MDHRWIASDTDYDFNKHDPMITSNMPFRPLFENNQAGGGCGSLSVKIDGFLPFKGPEHRSGSSFACLIKYTCSVHDGDMLVYQVGC